MLDPELLAALPFALRAEVDENVTRKNFSQSELAEIQRVVIEHWSAARKANQGKRSDLTSTKNFVEVGQVGRSENTTALVAKMFGESEPTVRKRLAVVDAAQAEPERFGPLVEDMDATGKVDRAYKLLKVEHDREAYQARREKGGTVADLEALAASGFRASAILADPPWKYLTRSEFGMAHTAAANHYEPMTLDDLAAFGARYLTPLAAKDCVLFLWATWPLLLPNSIQDGVGKIISAWGFEYKTCAFVWTKSTQDDDERLRWGNGYWTRSNSEVCLLATRGSPKRTQNMFTRSLRRPVVGIAPSRRRCMTGSRSWYSAHTWNSSPASRGRAG